MAARPCLVWLLLGFCTPSPHPGDVVPPCRAWTSPDKSYPVFPRPMQAERGVNRQPGAMDTAAGRAPHQTPSMVGTGAMARQINSDRAKAVM